MQGKFYNNVKTAFLLAALTGIILAIGSLGGRNGLIIALVMAGVMNFVSFFFSDKIALMAARAQQVGPGHPLYAIVQDLAQRAALPMPKVYISAEQAPNAFATGRNPKHAAVCATEGLMAMLDRNEVAAVMAHELAHVKHRDVLIQTVAATIGGAISYLGYMLMWGGRDDDGDRHPLAGLLVMILGPLAAGLIQAAISRSREFNADKVGAEIVGNPMYLATALEKVHYGNQRIPMQINPAFNSLFIAEPTSVFDRAARMFATHPPLEQRLKNLIGSESIGGRAPRRGFAA